MPSSQEMDQAYCTAARYHRRELKEKIQEMKTKNFANDRMVF